MSSILLIAIGGAVGSVLRYLVTVGCTHWLGTSWAYGTLLVNVIGSFCIGLVFSLLQHQILFSPYFRPLIMVGLLGGLTTFSTFSLDTYVLFIQNEWLKAGMNVALNMCLSFIAVAAGYQFLRLFS